MILKRVLPVLVWAVICSGPAIFNNVALAADRLVYSWSGDPGPLNPHLYSPNQMFAQALLYEPLVRYRADGSIQPWLAQNWEISADGRDYTFHLRRGVVFSDGTPFDAGAVKQNIDAVLRNHQRHQWLELINQLYKSDQSGTPAVEVVDPHTVKLHLLAPYYPVLQELALIRPLRFLSPQAFPPDNDTASGIGRPVGTGPWVLQEYRRGEYAVFSRNDSYWGEAPRIKELVVKVISDSNARAIAFETGAIDLIYGAGGHGGGQLGLETFTRFAAQPNVATSISAPLATRLLALNSGRFPTDELAVRQAIQFAVDKDSLVKHIFLGIEPRADTLFAPGMPYCDLGLPAYRYAPEKAVALLEQAGWRLPDSGEYRLKNGRELSLELCFVGNDSIQKAVAEVMQDFLRRVGIRAVLRGEEEDAFLARQKNGRFGMIFGDTWGAPYDPHSFCSAMRSPSHADYQAQSGLPMKEQIDKAIGQVLVSTGEAERRQFYRFILTTLHDQAVYLPISYMTSIMVHRPQLQDGGFGATKYEIPFERMSWTGQ